MWSARSAADYPSVPKTGFVPPYRPIEISDYFSYAFSGLSIILALFVLLAALYIYVHRQARAAIDRVSFRLMLLAMATEVVCNITYLALYGKQSIYEGKNHLCAGGVFVLLSSIAIINYLVTCIAINLMLCVCFGLNTVALKLERWYVGVSFFLGIVIEGVPALVGHYGWDPEWQDCYIYGGKTAQEERMRMFIDLYLWQSLACLVSVVAVMATLFKLFQQSRATQTAIIKHNPLSRASPPYSGPSAAAAANSGQPTSESPSTPHNVLGDRFVTLSPVAAPSAVIHPVPLPATSMATDNPATAVRTGSGSSWPSLGFRQQSTGSNGLRDKQVRANLNRLEDNFFGVAVRISWYPISLILINVILSVADLRTPFVENIDGMGIYVLYCIYLILYGGRGIVITLLNSQLAIFVDPCLRRGLRAVRQSKIRPRHNQRGASRPAHGGDVDFAELPHISARHDAAPGHHTDLTYPRGWSYKSDLGRAGQDEFPSGLTGVCDIEMDGDGQSGAGVLNVRMWGSPGRLGETRSQDEGSEVVRLERARANGEEEGKVEGEKEELEPLGVVPTLGMASSRGEGQVRPADLDLETGEIADWETLARRRDSEISFL